MTTTTTASQDNNFLCIKMETNVVRNKNSFVDNNSLFERTARRKISDISAMLPKPKICLRKLSLMSIKRNDGPRRLARDINDYRLQRSNSLPDTKTLSIMDTNLFSKLNNKRSDLIKTRSVTFHLETICLNAAADNDLVELKNIICDHEIDLNYTNGCGQTMCHCAASSGSYETLEYLVEQGAGVNMYDQRGFTPLDLAIQGDFFDCALLLIQSGAKVENIVNGVQ